MVDFAIGRSFIDFSSIMLHNESMQSCTPFFWAKTTEAGLPGCSVSQHAMATAAVAKHLCTILPERVRALLPQGWLTLIAVHDVGKISPAFQTQCAQWKGPFHNSTEAELYQWKQHGHVQAEHGHAMISELVLRQIYKERGLKNRFWPACVGAHHGVFRDCDRSVKLPDAWLEWAKGFVNEMEQKFGTLPIPPVAKNGQEYRRFLLTGLMSVADWIASNENCFPQDGTEVNYDIVAQDALRSIGLVQCPSPKQNATWQEIFPHALQPHAIQQYLWQLPVQAGIYIVEDSMGGGKTEAALGLAYHLWEQGVTNGIYFALPTQTTSNRLFFRMRDFLLRCGISPDEQTLRLAHGNSWLLRDSLYAKPAPQDFRAAAQSSAWELLRWFASSRRTLLAPFGVGTIDQALMAVLAVKHAAVRAFALSGKVVILDEIHSYDVYTGSLVTNLVQLLRQYGATVIILSATLTGKRCEELLGESSLKHNNYPLLSMHTNGGSCEQYFPPQTTKTILLECCDNTLESVAEQAYNAAEKGLCVLWIKNTVKEAQEAYRVLQTERREGGPEVGLLHARFPFWRREELETTWIDRLGKTAANRPNGCVLVATQVVEQSIDIDADLLITDLAPTDMLLQRAGRLWRHERPVSVRHTDQARMVLCMPADLAISAQQGNVKKLKEAMGGSGYVYAPYVLLRTWEQWRALPGITLPHDIRDLIEATYAEDVRDNPLQQELLTELLRKKEEMAAAARNNTSNNAGTMVDSEQPLTRFGGGDTVDVLLLKEKPREISPQRWHYAPLFGEQFDIVCNTWSFTAAQSISKNVVHVPAHMVRDSAPDEQLKIYSMNCIFSYFVLANGDLGMYDGSRSGLAWHPNLGITPSTVTTQQNDEAESMY